MNSYARYQYIQYDLYRCRGYLISKYSGTDTTTSTQKQQQQHNLLSVHTKFTQILLF